MASQDQSARKKSEQRLLYLLAIIFLLSSVASAPASTRTKTDVIFMRNGDKITCEIRSLEQGQLTVKPDYTDSSIVIDWNKVDHVESAQLFLVLDPKGTSFTGALSGIPETHAVIVQKPSPVTIPHESVIQIEPLGATFLRKLRGNFDMGLSFARSNAQKNLSVQGGLTYQSEKYLSSFTSNSQFTSQQKTNDTNETTVKSDFFRQLRESNWYGGAIANFLSSTEQQISLRSTLGAGIAKRVIFTNKTNLSAVAGLGYTIERDAAGTTSTARTRSLDSAFTVQYSTFRFDSTTLDTSIWVYPSLTSPGRVRMTLNQDVYYKFLGDFYIRVSFYDNYDNQPVVGAPPNNLGGSTTIGWSFH